MVIAETHIAGTEERKAIARAVKKAILQELDVFLAETYLVPREWIVKTTSGKISREENKKKYLQEKTLTTAFRRP